MTKNKTRYVYRDAGTGKFVTKKYAINHPGTTVRETVIIPQKKKRKK